MNAAKVWIIWFTLSVQLHAIVAAFPPTVKPNIFLAENLDESQQLGYCIDISGFKASINCGATQVHSCKTQGDDTQFKYDAAAKAIKAVNYDGSCSAGSGGCLSVLTSVAAGSKLQVTTCDGSALQTFVYGSSGEFVVGGGGSTLCLVAGAASRPAGKFMARDLTLAACSSTDKTLKTWTVIDASGSKVIGGDGKATQTTVAAGQNEKQATTTASGTNAAVSATRAAALANVGACVMIAGLHL